MISLREGDANLSTRETTLDKVIFDICLRIKRLLHTPTPSPPPPSPASKIKLPKIDVSTFGKSLLYWTPFWEQFEIAVHHKSVLSVAEKLSSLKQALKDSPARHVIEGLSGHGDNYAEAIECLQKRYDCPRLLHEAHIKAIVEASVLKDDTEREIRRLHVNHNHPKSAFKSSQSYTLWTIGTIYFLADSAKACRAQGLNAGVQPGFKQFLIMMTYENSWIWAHRLRTLIQAADHKSINSLSFTSIWDYLHMSKLSCCWRTTKDNLGYPGGYPK